MASRREERGRPRGGRRTSAEAGERGLVEQGFTFGGSTPTPAVPLGQIGQTRLRLSMARDQTKVVDTHGTAGVRQECGQRGNMVKRWARETATVRVEHGARNSCVPLGEPKRSRSDQAEGPVKVLATWDRDGR